MLKLKLHYFGHLMQRADSLEKTLLNNRLMIEKQQTIQPMLRNFFFFFILMIALSGKFTKCLRRKIRKQKSFQL